MIKQILIKEILDNFPRVLSILNKNQMDDLCGSFDREYWAWNFKDYPNLSLQSGTYLLSLVWNTKFEGNVYYGNAQVLNCVKESLFFWAKYQKNNGSFDQCYYNEQSYGTTSYTTLAVIKAYWIIKKELSGPEESILLKAINKSADFLIHHSERYGIISNHQAQYVYVFLLLAQFLNDDKFRIRYNELLFSFLARQNEEGWYQEYDGVDIGYLSQTIYYSALCYGITQDKRIFAALNKAVNFCSYFIHPDGSCGGAYGSRFNENFYPAGFAVLSDKLNTAGKILEFCITKNNKNISIGPLDPENLIRVMINYIETLNLLSTEKVSNEKMLPCEEEDITKLFEDAGFYIRGNKSFYTIISIKKGGCISVYDKIDKIPLYIDPGYLLLFSDGVKATNGVFQNAEFRITDNNISVDANFFKVSMPNYTPLKGFLLRIMSFTILKIGFINNWFKEILVTKLIRNRRESAAAFNRQITFGSGDIGLSDTITFKKSGNLPTVIESSEFRPYKMSSVGYYFKPLPRPETEKIAQDNLIIIKRKVNRL